MYKAFEDHYKEQPIRHLLLAEHNGALISPPFATELCKDYSKVAVINDRTVEYIDLDLGDATSKFNAVAKVGESSWLIPYAIWDDFNVVVQLENLTLHLSPSYQMRWLESADFFSRHQSQSNNQARPMHILPNPHNDLC